MTSRRVPSRRGAGTRGSGSESELSESKRRLLELRLRGTAAPTAATKTIPRRSGSGPVSASLGQEGVFAAHQSDPASPSFNITSSFRVEGDLDVARLERLVTLVIERHEVLRSNYRATDDGVELCVRDRSSLRIERHQADSETDAVRLAAELVRSPFDLEIDPLVRLHHIAVAEGCDLLTLVVHDIVFDKWSLGRFWTEVAELYRSSDEEPALESLSVQYPDFAVWQRETLGSDGLDRQRAYWRHRLTEAPGPLPLPTDRAYPGRLTDAGRLERGRLSPELTARLVRFAASEDTSLFTVLLLAYQVLLARYSGTHDIVVASPIANRRQRETNELIGFFLSTVPLRARIDEEMSFRDALREAKTAVLEAIEHQDVPFHRIVEAARPPRVAGRHPLCQVMFVHQRQNEGAPEFDLGTVQLRHCYVDTATSKYDMTLFAAESGEATETVLEYRTDLFDERTAARVLRHYERLLSSLVENPDLPLSRARLLTAAEERDLFEAWQGGALEEPLDDRSRTVVGRISAQSEAHPNRVAVLSGEASWTYGKLNQESARIATLLEQAGVTEGDSVAHFVERSALAIGAICGIHRIGAAYVPLDPNYPSDRNQRLIEAAGIRVAVSTAALAPRLDGLVRQVVVLDRADATSGDDGPGFEPSPDSPAYLIFTSGSTGQPKGVVVSHRNLERSTAARPVYYEAPPGRFLLVPSLAFDSSVAGLFWTLAEGRTLVVASAEEQRDPNQLAELIRRHDVTDLLCIPSLYRELLAQAEGRLGSLKRSIVAGEVCPRDLVALHREVAPGAELYNEYGPTEATVWSTVHRCASEEVGTSVPIGRPIPGAEVYLLDNRLRPVPSGVPAQLFLGGPGVVQGYRGDDALTARKFVEVTIGGSRRRLYATGDIGRHRSDGAIEFLGRRDGQVKLRGHRIELGEVEAVLCGNSAVFEAAAATRRIGGSDRLVGYFRSAAGCAPTPDALLEYLRSRLPAYSVPHVLVPLEELPRLPNGKIDRNSLPDPPTVERPPAADRSMLSEPELLLLAVWETVLGVEGISVDDDFFSLGGDSLMSIQIVSGARAKGLRIAPRDVADARTIARLAERSRRVDDSPPVTETEASRLAPFPLTPIQRWFFSRELAQPEQWALAAVAALDPTLSDVEVETAVERVVRRHDQLRTGFRREAEEWIQQVVPEADLFAVGPSPGEVGTVGTDGVWADRVRSTQRDFTFDGSPLARFVLYRGASTLHLLVVAHHLVIDAVSWRILFEDVDAALRSEELGPSTTSFGAWARGLAEAGAEGELPFWSAPSRTPSRLPLDRPDAGDLTEGESEVVEIELDADLSRRLFGDALEAYNNSPDELMLLALGRAMNGWCTREHFRIGLERHGRDVLGGGYDASRTVGWFTSAFPLRMSVSKAGALDEELKAIKESVRAVPRSGIGYGQLRYGEDERARRLVSTDETSEDVLFNYLGDALGSPNGDGAIRGVEHLTAGARAPENTRSHPLEVNAWRQNRRLAMAWTFARTAHDRATVEGWVDDFVTELRAVVEHCVSEESGGYTPSDFPDAGLSQAELDALLEGL